MLPEDSVLVGVINRKRDLVYARDQHWYRIPQERMPRGVTAAYLAFFLSRSFGDRNGAIHFFAENHGLELHYRRDLLPNEPDHPRADAAYYRVALGDVQPKIPPVVNDTKRTISFIYTTWDRFVHAQTIADLYTDNDAYVDRLFYALHQYAKPYNVTRTWEAERRVDDFAPGLRILCENGATVIASVHPSSGAYYLDRSQGEDSILQAILAQIASNGGPATISIPPGE
jgi:hypothetical protein